MTHLAFVDRIALAAVFATIGAIPLIAHAAQEPSARTRAPSATVALAGGAERRFFASGPAGTTTYRVDISPSGAVLSEIQVLSDDVFRTIQPGLAAADVFARIGPPYAKVRFEATRTTSWDYHYRDTWGYDADFSVLVDDAGLTVGTASLRNGN